jgi:beta-lactamase regulating signal transducer with metallopeptidase domain/tetratricopeptide (TPR) repeat protein
MNTLIQNISSYLQHAAFTAPFLDAWLKSLVVLAVAAGLCFLLPRAAAATRHWIWFLAVASLPCLLLLACLPRSWHRPLWSVSTGFDSGNQVSLTLNLAPAGGAAGSVTPASPARTGAAADSQAVSRRSQPIAAWFSATWLVVAFGIWFFGAALGLISVLLCHIRLTRLGRQGCRVETPDWALLLRQACDTLRLRRQVRVWQAADNLMPLTWGWWRPVVLLPAEAAHWPAPRRRVVLLHELAHVKRWDCLTQTVARVVRALYWVNPLVWLATRRMCVEREQACDDLVLSGGCKASDYATQLVEIAQTYRHIPQVAAIAMARSSQIKGRIAAIVDASRARRARPLTAMALLVLMGAFVLSVGGSNSDTPRGQMEASSLRQEQIAHLQSFAEAKEQQSRELAAKAGEQITPEFQRFFDAATSGDWQTVTNRYDYFKLHHPQYASIHGTNGMEVNLRAAYWSPVLELCLAYDHVANCEPKYTAIFADGIINSIPAGSIYFGGTDPGRGVPTAFCRSHADGDPFFTLTQNALADGTYLEYLRAMYGGKIYLPTGEDSQRCFQEYMADAQRRLAENKLRPGENVKNMEVDGHPRVEVSGQVAVMSINGLLTKVIFDHNPDREFYVEESFPLDWMYPYLEPHGLIMKINRQPLAPLPAETLAADREYWRKLVAGMLGDWLDEKTPVSEVAAFVDRVYVRHNLKEFTGDPLYIGNDYAKKTFSKLRSSIGGLYAWRLGGDIPSKYRPKSDTDRQTLSKEADLAFRQSFALCPYSPEAVFRYAQLLLQLNRKDDALLVAQTCLKLDPDNRQVLGLVNSIQSFKKQAGEIGQAVDILQHRIDKFGATTTNIQEVLDQANTFLQMQQTNRAIQVLDKAVSDPGADTGVLVSVAQQYAQMGNVPKLEATLERLVKLPAAGPEAWYDLAALKAGLGKSSEALAALKQALEQSAERLQRDPKARDLLKEARRDARFDTLRQTPEFKNLVSE